MWCIIILHRYNMHKQLPLAPWLHVVGLWQILHLAIVYSYTASVSVCVCVCADMQ